MGVLRPARAAGAMGAAVGVLAAGAAAGLAAERYLVGRRRVRGDPDELARFFSLRGDLVQVVTDDGTRLHAEVDDQPDAPLTVVFCHGYTLTLDCWHYQRLALRGAARLVFYDQRGHGRSARGPREHATIDQLGADLRAVLDAVAPSGPVVLVGHSMGGMTVMALAERHPEMFGDRVRGVALLSTSAGKLAEVVIGVPALTARAVHRVAPHMLEALARRGALVERGRRAGSDIGVIMTRRYSFGSRVSPALAEFTARMIESTPIDVIADFFPAFAAHDKLHALGVLDGVETLVVGGEKDLLTPADHSREIARSIPGSELVVVPEAGHMVLLEHPDVVNGHLRDLVDRAATRSAGRRGRAGRPRRRRWGLRRGGRLEDQRRRARQPGARQPGARQPGARQPGDEGSVA